MSFCLSESEDDNLSWKVVRPGLISLGNTKYEIEYIDMVYEVRWANKKIGRYYSLQYAKFIVNDHMKAMIEMGYEP
jgi:hypothetical protein